MSRTIEEIIIFCKKQAKGLNCPEFGFKGEYTCVDIALAYLAVIHFICPETDIYELLGWGEK